MGWLIVGVVVVLAALAFGGVKTTKRDRAPVDPVATIRSELAARGFTASEVLQTDTVAVAFDPAQRAVAFITLVGGKPTATRVVPHQAIISSAILRDDVAVVKAERRDAVGIDPVLAAAPSADHAATTLSRTTAGIGALASGLAGTAQLNARLKLSRLAVRVVLDPPGEAEVVIRVVDLQRPDYLSAYWLRPQIAAVELWHVCFAALIQLADQERPAPVPLPAPSDPAAETAAADASAAHATNDAPGANGANGANGNGAPPSPKLIADELNKLASLLQQGLLTRKQFEEQRDRVLGVE